MRNLRITYDSSQIGINNLKGGSLCRLILRKNKVIKYYKGSDPRGIEKLEKEIKYLQTLPEELEEYFPRVIDTWHAKNYVAYSMPYYNMKSLSKHLLGGTLDEESVWCILRKVLDFMERNVYSRDVTRSIPNNYLQQTHFNRVRTSLNILKSIFVYSNIVQAKELTLNGQTLENPNKLLHSVENDQELVDIIRPDKLSFFHGNLHLDNILADSEKFILIDPRGELRGTQDYDDAKLFKTLHSRYDEVHYGLFELLKSGSDFNLKFTHPHIGRKYDFLFDKFLEYKFDKCENKDRQIYKMLLLESFHMLSLASYHARKIRCNKSAVISFYLIGLKILNDCVNNKPVRNHNQMTCKILS